MEGNKHCQGGDTEIETAFLGVDNLILPTILTLGLWRVRKLVVPNRFESWNYGGFLNFYCVDSVQNCRKDTGIYVFPFIHAG